MTTLEGQPSLIATNRDINVLNRTMRRIARHGPEQHGIVAFTVRHVSETLAMQLEDNPEKARSLGVWQNGKVDLDRALKEMTGLMREMVAEPGSMQEKIASMTVRTLSVQIVETNKKIESAKI